MMTLEEVLQATREILANINVPAGLTEQISIPVSHAISNLDECLFALRAQKSEEPQEPHPEPADDVPEVDVEVEEIQTKE